MNNFRKVKALLKVKFDISELFIQCNKDSCYELITVGVNMYFYGCVSLLGPDSAVCLCICVYMCVSVFVGDQIRVPAKNTLRVRPQQTHSVHPRPSPFFGVESPTGKEGVNFSREEGCSFYKKIKV